jgi:hypothetical protein
VEICAMTSLWCGYCSAIGLGVGTVRTQVSIAVIFMAGRCYNGAGLAAAPARQEITMKTLYILAVCALLALAGCNRNEPAKGDAAPQKAPPPQGSMETPKGGATGQASEGSTDTTKAPQRPASK